MVGFWATLSLNIPDFTRYARTQRDQMLGQVIGLPTTMTLFAFIGVAVTSATVVIFGEAIWDPVRAARPLRASSVVVLLRSSRSPSPRSSTNIAANVVSPGQRLLEPLRRA